MPFIECIWTLKAARDSVQLVTPDGCVDILVRASGSTYRVDQAHMIRDFKAFAKNTPARFRAVS